MGSAIVPSFGAALAVHAALLAAVGVVRAPRDADVAAAPPPEPIEVVLAIAEPSRAPDEPALDAKPHVETTSDAPRGEARAKSAELPKAREPVAASSAEVVPVSPPEPTPSSSSDRARDAVAGLFGGKLAVPGVHDEAPEERAPAAPAVGKEKGGEALRDALDRHDVSLGLGSGGPVATAARDAAMAPDVPQTGAATIEVLTNEDGAITSVRAATVSPGWERVVAALAASLAARHLRVPKGSRGLRVIVRVEAHLQLPSGSDRPHHTAPGTTAEFDLSDLGAPRSRAVSATVVSESRLLRRNGHRKARRAESRSASASVAFPVKNGLHPFR